jgi:indole-3-glycerol phosphate synthase/phosphoribosylanthranilate isomerase
MSARFLSAIKAENERGFAAVIPDIKCVSPKEGDLLQGRDPVETAKYLIQCGAPLLSVVTERERFGGSPELLRAIVEKTGVPVLRKDFITSEWQLEETLGLGAAAILLICAIMDENKLRRLYEKAISLELEPFVEVCTAQEMELARKLGARLVGVNNRDITTLERDDGGPSRTAALAGHAPDGALLVSESGILSEADAKLAVAAGADAILVGTALWRAGDMGEKYKSLRTRLSSTAVKICGLTRPKDIDAVNTALPDYAGFVFAEHRLRITERTAIMLKERLDPRIKAVGVFISETIENITSLGDTIDMIQLHGNENEEYIKKLKSLTDKPIIKAHGYAESSADYLLFDSDKPASGKAFDWNLIPKTSKPFFLAGGLCVDNIAEAIRCVRPFAVDVSSGMETDGVKDPDKIFEFVRMVRRRIARC